MSNKMLSVLLLCSAVMIGHPIKSASAEDITVVSFGGLIQELFRNHMWKPFAEREKATLHEDERLYGIGTVRTKLQGGSTWDVIGVEDIEAIQGCEEGLFKKIDWSKIAGRNGLLPWTKLECGVGANIYSMSLAYDGNKIANGPKSWADFWNVQKWPGKRAIWKDPRDTLEMALLADGVARDDVYKVLATPAGVDRAFRKLDELKPHILFWANPGQSRQMLASGDAAMIATFEGGVINVNRREKTNFKLAVEGRILHTDYWVIANTTKHQALAEKYLDFVSRADVQAAFATNAWIGVPNSDANKTIPKEVQALISTGPDNIKNIVPTNPNFWLDNFDRLNKRFTDWAAR